MTGRSRSPGSFPPATAAPPSPATPSPPPPAARRSPPGEAVRTTTVTGLNNGTSYTFSVRATNAAGSSPAATVSARPAPGSVVVDRWAGTDRYATAALISKESFSPGVPVAYVAIGSNYPDALAGAAVAGHRGGPVLLTRDTALANSTAVELARLRPQRIVVIGGQITDDVLTQLRGYATANTADEVTRIAGKDRYATAAGLSETFPSGVEVAYVASGLNFPDALAGAAVAGHRGGPVLLTRKDGLPAPIAAELARLRPKRVVVIGGEVSISDSVLTQLRSYATANTADEVTRVAGKDRYATAAGLSETFPSGVEVAYVASGLNFPDALAGAAAAGAAGGSDGMTYPRRWSGWRAGAYLTQIRGLPGRSGLSGFHMCRRPRCLPSVQVSGWTFTRDRCGQRRSTR